MKQLQTIPSQIISCLTFHVSLHIRFWFDTPWPQWTKWEHAGTELVWRIRAFITEKEDNLKDDACQLHLHQAPLTMGALGALIPWQGQTFLEPMKLNRAAPDQGAGHPVPPTSKPPASSLQYLLGWINSLTTKLNPTHKSNVNIGTPACLSRWF